MIPCSEFSCVFSSSCDLVACSEDCENFSCESCFYVLPSGGCCLGWSHDPLDQCLPYLNFKGGEPHEVSRPEDAAEQAAQS